MNDMRLFTIFEQFPSPAPDYVEVNDLLTSKLKWYTLEDRSHAVGVRFQDFDAKPRDLLTDCDPDIVQQLKKPNARLIVRNNLESKFLRLTNCIYDHIHATIDKHNLDPNRICYISSNINEQKVYHAWCTKNRISNKIQVFGVVGWWEFSLYNFTEYDRTWRTDYKAKQFLCLNRRLFDAPHRQSLLYHLHRLGQINRGLVSSTGHEDIDLISKNSWDEKTYLASARKRIIDIDAETVGAGVAADTNTSNLHRLTAFSIVSESSWNNENGTHRFYTEKTMRAALYGHPFFIIGEAGANTDLVRLGIEPYTELWDIGTDFISNTDARVSAQLDSVRWDWDARNMHHELAEKIQHNRAAVMQNTFNRRVLKRIKRWAFHV